MGRDLAPDYPLFSADAVAAQDESLPNFEPSEPLGIDPLSAFNEESILDIPGLDEGKAGKQSTVDAHSEQVAENELDLTLDLDDLSMPHSIAQDEESLEGLESIELELPDLDMNPAKKAVASDVSDDSLLLELDTSLEDSVADEGAEQDVADVLDAESLQAQLEELSDLTDLDDELSQLTADFEGMSEPAPAAEPEVLAMPEDAGMDLEVPPPFAEQMADEDEVQTKLDLAIAYVEMGDKEGARSILDEVRAEGSSEQQAEAERLLADINV
jgi:pilus assembly protein FimV